MHLKPIILTCITSIISVGVNAQSPTIDINGPQRTRVLNTKGLEAPPSQVLWKSEKLFHYRASEWVTAETGPFRFNVDLPTGQDFSAPIIAGDLLYFTYVAHNGYLFVIEKATGRSCSF